MTTTMTKIMMTTLGVSTYMSKFNERGPPDDVNYEANDDDDGEDYNDDAST